MDSWNINGYTLEYDDESHTYIVDGVIVPSVTQILAVKFGNKYAEIDAATLQRAAERGTAIHEAIETYCKTGIESAIREVHNFRFLQKHYGFNVLENETPIIIIDKSIPKAAGRLDLVLEIKGETALADIKTTATLDKEYLAYQLNLYRIGYMQSYCIDISKLYGVHLKDDKRKLVNIPTNANIAWDIIDQYERGRA